MRSHEREAISNAFVPHPFEGELLSMKHHPQQHHTDYAGQNVTTKAHA